MAIKVLHIITKLELGGAQKSVLELLALLDKRIYDVHLISSDGLMTEYARSIPGIHLKILPSLRRMPDPIFDLAAFLSIIRYIKKERIELVHTHSSKAGILGRLAARVACVPVIIHSIHGWGFHDIRKSHFNGLYIFLERLAGSISTKLIAVSESDIKQGLRNGIASKEKYILIRYGLDSKVFDSNKYDKSQIRKELGLKDSRVVGMVSCLKPQKNPLDYIKAAALIKMSLPDVKFILVGDGILRGMVEREVKKRGLENSFFLLGWRNDVPRVLSSIDVAVLTSLWEGLPFAILESLSSSKPVVSYNTCGISEVLKDSSNGFLVEPGNIELLADRILQLLEDTRLLEEMGRKARQSIEREEFKPGFMADRVDKVYRDCIKASNLSF